MSSSPGGHQNTALIVAGVPLTRPRVMTWICLGFVICAAWLALFAQHGAAGLALQTIEALCLAVGGSIGLALYPSVLLMWLLMAVAMMLPTALPTIDLYLQLTRRLEAARGLHVTMFVCGYLVAWFSFATLAAGLQIGLRAYPVDHVPPMAAAGLLLVLAGSYQQSSLKAACLALCRNPMMFFMARWREGASGALWLGMQHGLICIGCCWALMMLMFVTGTMNLLWMALLGAAMLAEKLLPGADRWGRFAGHLMIAAGAATVIATLL